jgi:hypothetical protein
MVESQAFKDATMAKFILANLKPATFFMHYNGAYHSDFYQGIMWYLLKSKPDLRITTISTVTQTDINTLENEVLAEKVYQSLNDGGIYVILDQIKGIGGSSQMSKATTSYMALNLLHQAGGKTYSKN